MTPVLPPRPTTADSNEIAVAVDEIPFVLKTRPSRLPPMSSLPCNSSLSLRGLSLLSPFPARQKIEFLILAFLRVVSKGYLRNILFHSTSSLPTLLQKKGHIVPLKRE